MVKHPSTVTKHWDLNPNQPFKEKSIRKKTKKGCEVSLASFSFLRLSLFVWCFFSNFKSSDEIFFVFGSVFLAGKLQWKLRFVILVYGKLGWWFQFFFSSRALGKMNPFWLAHIFQRGWFNRQLEKQGCRFVPHIFGSFRMIPSRIEKRHYFVDILVFSCWPNHQIWVWGYMLLGLYNCDPISMISWTFLKSLEQSWLMLAQFQRSHT